MSVTGDAEEERDYRKRRVTSKAIADDREPRTGDQSGDDAVPAPQPSRKGKTKAKQQAPAESEEEVEEEDPSRLYCLCKQPYDNQKFMIQ